MFGGDVGAFTSQGKHFLDKNNPVYQQLAEVFSIRQNNIALNRGRRYLRVICKKTMGFNLACQP
jgi:hypothetical protein